VCVNVLEINKPGKGADYDEWKEGKMKELLEFDS
jgi:hypothetical protein